MVFLPLLIFGSKGQRSNLDFKLFAVSAPQLNFLLAYNNDTLQMYWPWPERDLYWFWGRRIKGQGNIWSLIFVSFPHDNSNLFLAYNDDTCTAHMYKAWPKEEIFWFWDQNVKGQVHILTLNVVPFPHGNFSFWHALMKLWWYGGFKRPKVKGTFHVGTIDRFRIVTLLPFDIQFWYFTHVFPISQCGPLSISRSIGQG